MIENNLIRNYSSIKDISNDYPYDGNLYGAKNFIDLILSRAGIFINWENEDMAQKMQEKFICKRHLLELGTQWDGKYITNHIERRRINEEKRLACSIPPCLDGHLKTPPIISTKHNPLRLTRDEAESIFKTRGILAHVGIRNCSTFIQSVRKKLGIF